MALPRAVDDLGGERRQGTITESFNEESLGLRLPSLPGLVLRRSWDPAQGPSGKPHRSTAIRPVRCRPRLAGGRGAPGRPARKPPACRQGRRPVSRTPPALPRPGKQRPGTLHSQPPAAGGRIGPPRSSPRCGGNSRPTRWSLAPRSTRRRARRQAYLFRGLPPAPHRPIATAQRRNRQAPVLSAFPLSLPDCALPPPERCVRVERGLEGRIVLHSLQLRVQVATARTAPAVADSTKDLPGIHAIPDGNVPLISFP